MLPAGGARPRPADRRARRRRARGARRAARDGHREGRRSGTSCRSASTCPLLETRPDQRDARARLGLPLDGPIVGCVGRLVPVKDHDTLFRAARRVLAARPDATFVLAGDGELRDRLQREAIELLGDRVRFLGWVHDLPALYAAFDVVVLTSKLEGTPVALIEAAAAGRPVVATNVGGVSRGRPRRQHGPARAAPRRDRRGGQRADACSTTPRAPAAWVRKGSVGPGRLLRRAAGRRSDRALRRAARPQEMRFVRAAVRAVRPCRLSTRRTGGALGRPRPGCSGRGPPRARACAGTPRAGRPRPRRPTAPTASTTRLRLRGRRTTRAPSTPTAPAPRSRAPTASSVPLSGQPVRRVIGAASQQRASVAQPRDHDHREVEQRHAGEQHGGEHARQHRPHRKVELEGERSDQEAEQHRPGVAEEDARRGSVVAQEPDRGAGGGERERRDEEVAVVGGDHRDAGRRGRGHARRDAVHVVDHVERVHDRDHPEHGERQVEQQRCRTRPLARRPPTGPTAAAASKHSRIHGFTICTSSARPTTASIEGSAEHREQPPVGPGEHDADRRPCPRRSRGPRGTEWPSRGSCARPPRGRGGRSRRSDARPGGPRTGVSNRVATRGTRNAIGYLTASGSVSQNPTSDQDQSSLGSTSVVRAPSSAGSLLRRSSRTTCSSGTHPGRSSRSTDRSC